MRSIFITGTGTGIGKTVCSAVLAEALKADYWKPIQAGFEDGTDAGSVRELISNEKTFIHRELYKLALPASPHISARAEGLTIDTDLIAAAHQDLPNQNNYLLIEGAGGIMVPLNEKEFVIDLIKKLNASAIIVSRNYLGSINHSLLTAMALAKYEIPVLGWVFNDQFMHYEDELVGWTGIPKIGSLPWQEKADQRFVAAQAEIFRPVLSSML
jgi:dethiobiotin synthetase